MPGENIYEYIKTQSILGEQDLYTDLIGAPHRPHLSPNTAIYHVAF